MRGDLLITSRSSGHSPSGIVSKKSAPAPNLDARARRSSASRGAKALIAPTAYARYRAETIPELMKSRISSPKDSALLAAPAN